MTATGGTPTEVSDPDPPCEYDARHWDGSRWTNGIEVFPPPAFPVESAPTAVDAWAAEANVPEAYRERLLTTRAEVEAVGADLSERHSL